MLTAESGESAGQRIFFRRSDFDAILRCYGKLVSAGEWRDYAIDSLRDRAVFSVFRRASESALYQIEYKPALARRQGAFCVSNSAGLVLKRGHDIAGVLRVFDRLVLRLVSD